MESMIPETYLNVYIGFLRYAAPILVILLLFRCFRPLLTFRKEPEIWAWLMLQDGSKLPITHWENTIGRHKKCDIHLDFPTVSRHHGVLTRYDDGSWTISDTDSSGGILVNGEKTKICALQPDDVIDVGGIEMMLVPISRVQEERIAQLRSKGTGFGYNLANVFLLTVFQFLCAVGYMLSSAGTQAQPIIIGFGGIMICQWLLLLFYVCIRRTSYEVETIAFFLCTMGMCAISAVTPGESTKQLIAMYLGVFLFLILGWCLRNLERAKKVRYLAGIAGIGFLIITLVFGQEYYGAKNWLVIGPLSLQPSELSKVCFVFIGASAMDRLLRNKNLIMFIAYSVMICGCLALMNDFGTALIFFVAFLVIAYMRSGSVGTVALAITSLGFAGVVALKIAPHALRRFASWRHIWEDPLNAGYQQPRSLMCMASGGFLGLGAGKGYMKNIFAADSDVVVATICEEWGLVVMVLMVLSVVVLAFFAVRSAGVGRSSFYVIGGCTAAAVLLIQVILNALGTVDVVPLTGVTFPFVSNGGSSMIGAWGLLAFVKAADTRQNASFAVRLQKRGGKNHE